MNDKNKKGYTLPRHQVHQVTHLLLLKIKDAHAMDLALIATDTAGTILVTKIGKGDFSVCHLTIIHF